MKEETAKEGHCYPLTQEPLQIEESAEIVNLVLSTHVYHVVEHL